MGSRVDGKVAVVSGGASGVGEAAVRLLAEAGAKVAILDRAVQAGERVAANMVEEGHDVEFYPADVSQSSDVTKAVGDVIARYGRVDILFNHAGTLIVKPFLETTDEEWDRLMEINVKSMYLVTKAVLPHMIAGGGGSIVCTSSISAVAATPMEVLYDTTKGACHMFARAIAVEFRDRGIRCNAVCPGFIRTPHGIREVAELTRYGVDVSEEALAVSQGRMCEPEEVARVVVFLASDDASFINGAQLFVDNGFTSV